jgi:hypothetical protein
MKRKGHSTIPDFSRARPGIPPVPSGQTREQKAAGRPVAPVRAIKPHATSAKSGRRGQ